ncbi:MAG: glycosyltransferase family 39 protein [Bdellovibrio sp.]|nr:glycosyltransferase family 39 protein [Bdellovibrio sp.]
MLPKKIASLLLLIVAAKCLLATFFPLVADEAYYYVWSLRPQLSYYDHPGMVSWLIYIGTHLLTFKDPFTVRLMFITLSTLSLYVWILILKKLNVSEKLTYFFILLYCLNPMLGIGSILATPDVPLIFFWSLSYLFFLNLLAEKKWHWYFLFGASLGLGFCSKYLIVLFVLAGIVALTINKKYKNLWFKGILITIFSGLIFSSPVLIWNYNNEWVSFLFQLKHGYGRTYYNAEWTYGYLLGQFFILSPLIFIQLFKKPHSLDRYFSLTQILFFITSTFKSVVEANWAVTSYAHGIVHFVQSSSRRFMKYTLFYWGFIYIGLFIFLMTPGGLKALKNQPTSSDVVVLRGLSDKYQPLYGPTYQISSLLTWDQQKLIPKLQGLSRLDFFDHMPESVPNEKTIYVLKYKDTEWPESTKGADLKQLDQFDDLGLELFRVTYE